MKLITLTTALALTASTAFATPHPQPPKEPEPPVVEVTPSGGNNDWLAPLVVIVGVGIAVYALSQPKTANCDTISNQMIYGADGKPLVVGETDPCE